MTSDLDTAVCGLTGQRPRRWPGVRAGQDGFLYAGSASDVRTGLGICRRLTVGG